MHTLYMNKASSPSQHFDKISELLTSIKIKTNAQTDVIWSRYETPQELIDDLDAKIVKLRASNYDVLGDLYMLFAPTGSFQEISLSNGWSEEFLELAESFELLYKNLKNIQ